MRVRPSRQGSVGTWRSQLEEIIGRKSAELAARLYRAHHHSFTDDLPFWSAMAAQYGDPVLELGCGTGRVLLALATAGYRVFGLDRDASRLAILRQELPLRVGEHVHIWQADMGNFCLALQFSLALLPCNTLSTLDAGTRQRMVACLSRHLRPGGVFAACRPNPLVLQQMPAYSESEIETYFAHPLTGEPVQVSSAWERGKHWFILHWNYDHLLPDGRVERITLETRHDFNPLENYQGELQAAGLELFETWGDFDRSPYRPESPNLILVARKP